MNKTIITIFKTENDERIFFTEGNLRKNHINKNSKKVSFWDGTNWVTECITFLNRQTRVGKRNNLNYKNSSCDYHYEWLFEYGTIIAIIAVKGSNMSGSLTPYYKEDR